MKDRKREGGKTGNEVEGVKEQRMKNRRQRKLRKGRTRTKEWRKRKRKEA